MKYELNNAIRLGICLGLINNFSQPTRMRLLSSRDLSIEVPPHREKTEEKNVNNGNRAALPRNVFMNCHFRSCGTGVVMEGDSEALMINTTIEGCETGFEISGNSYLVSRQLSIKDSKTAFRVT